MYWEQRVVALFYIFNIQTENQIIYEQKYITYNPDIKIDDKHDVSGNTGTPLLSKCYISITHVQFGINELMIYRRVM